MSYDKISHQFELAMTSEAIQAALNGRYDDIAGIWKNVRSEQTHSKMHNMSYVKNGNSKMCNIAIDMTVR